MAGQNTKQTIVREKHVAIDGKTLRGSHDKAKNKSAIHVISAWAAENGIVLGQIKTDEKSNEITAIPELTKQLELKGAVASIDAMGCQKAIARQIVDKRADCFFFKRQSWPSSRSDSDRRPGLRVNPVPEKLHAWEIAVGITAEYLPIKIKTISVIGPAER